MKSSSKQVIMAGQFVKGMDEEIFHKKFERNNYLYNRSIFKVPIHLRQSNENAYDPRMISIGPYHRGKEHLKAMEVHKKHYLRNLLERRHETSVERYLKALRKIEEEARAFYSEPLDHISGEEFTQMLLLDGCFIVEFIRQKQVRELNYETIGDGLVTNLISRTVTRDFLLIENQLPLLVLVRLFHMTRMPNHQEDLKDMIFSFFSDMMPGVGDQKTRTEAESETTKPIIRPTRTKNTISDSNQLEKHPLDLLHSIYIGCSVKDEIFLLPDEISDDAPDQVRVQIHDTPKVYSSRCLNPDEKVISKSSEDEKEALTPPAESSYESDQRRRILMQRFKVGFMSAYKLCAKKSAVPEVGKWKPIPTATELREAGVEFKKIDNGSFSLIKFEKGVMWIPTFKVDDTTESILRNFIALEQCFRNNQKKLFSDFATFMDCLINKREDVALLCENGIIDNRLCDSEAVATIFNGHINSVMNKGEYFIYTEVFNKVQEHCEKKYNLWMANLRQNYFNTPWAWISFIAALFLLMLTVLQSVYTVLPFYK